MRTTLTRRFRQGWTRLPDGGRSGGRDRQVAWRRHRVSRGVPRRVHLHRGRVTWRVWPPGPTA